MEARRKALEVEVDEADERAESLQSQLPSKFYRAFPLLDNFGETMEGAGLPHARWKLLLLGMLVTASVVVLPLAVVLDNSRSDVRAARRAKRAAKRARAQLAEAQRTLNALPPSPNG